MRNAVNTESGIAGSCPSALRWGLAMAMALVLGSIGAGTAWAQSPNPALPGVDCNAIIANAQANQADSSGTSGVDNWGSTCATSFSLEGWGYDYKHVYLWVADNGSGGQNLYVCVQLYGHPGDSDADGGYISNDAPNCGAWPADCAGDEVEGIVGPSEEITLGIDPGCESSFTPRLTFTLTNDILLVINNQLGAGPGDFTPLGGQGAVWQAAPLVPNGADSSGQQACTDPASRQGAVIFCIEDFDAYFANRPDLSPYLFNWRIRGGHSADQLSEDSVLGTFRQDPSIDIVKTVSPDTLCATGDVATFELIVTNNGFAPLFNVTVRDTLPVGLVYDAALASCELGAPVVDGQVVTWTVDTLAIGDSRTCSFAATADGCVGEVCNVATVSADVLHPCLPQITVFDNDQACVTCVEACAIIAADDTSACVGEFVVNTASVTNCANIPAEMSVECFIDGQSVSSVDLGVVAAGATVPAAGPQIDCTQADTVTVTCIVTSNPVGFVSCTAADTTTYQVICRDAIVAIDVNPTGASLDACVGDTVRVEVTVTNNSAEAATLTLNCFLDANPVTPAPTLNNPFAAGASQTITVPVICTVPGQVAVACTASAALVSDPTCTDTKDDDATVTCREADVTVEVLPDLDGIATCVGQTVEVPVKATNTGSHAANIDLSCVVQGGGGAIAVNFPNVAPGASVLDTVFVTCTTEGTVAVDCSATATLVANALCTANASDSDTVTCDAAAVLVTVSDAAACVGDSATVTVKAYNTSSGSENITVNCSFSGSTFDPIVVLSVAAGDSVVSTFTVPCTSVGVSDFICNANAALTGNTLCTAADADTGQVTCRDALVAIDVNPTGASLDACVGDTVRVEVTVTNNSAEAATLTLNCFLDANPVTPAPTLNNPFAAGASQTITVPVICTVPGQVAVACTASAALVSDPTCTDTKDDDATVTCREADVTVEVLPDLDGIATCVGQTVEVPVKATNTGSHAANIDLSCVVQGGGGAIAVNFPNVAPGASVLDTVFVTCTTEGTVAVDCSATATLVANALCTANASDSDTVTCDAAAVLVTVPDAAACVGDSATVTVKAYNTSSGSEDITLTCTFGGDSFGPFVVLGVAAGDSIESTITVYCDQEGVSDFICNATATLNGNTACNAADADTGQVTCREASLEIVVNPDQDPLEYCVGDTARVKAVVTNTSTEPAFINMFCSRSDNGVDYDEVDVTNFGPLAPGQSDSAEYVLVCTEAGLNYVRCSGIVFLVSDETCDSQAADTVEVNCRQTLVDVEVLPGVDGATTCAGQTVDVPVKVTNNSSDAADITLSCTVGGGAALDTTFTNVAAGAMDSALVAVLCEVPGQIAVACEAIAVLVDNPACADTAADADTVTCDEATIVVEVADGVACVGDSSSIEVCVKNTSAGAEDFFLECFINGELVKSGPGELAAGDSLCILVPVYCDTVGTVDLICNVTAALVDNPDCLAADSDTGTVTCLEACVEMVVGSATGCVGDTLKLPVTLTNCGDEPGDITAFCVVEGDTAFVTIPGASPGVPNESTIDFICEEAFSGPISCYVTITDPVTGCTAADSSQGTITCIQPCLTVDIQAPPGSNINSGVPTDIPIRVENCATDSMNVTLICTTDGVNPDTTMLVMGPGEVQSPLYPVVCAPGDTTVTILCVATGEVVGLPGCTAEAADEVTLTCDSCKPCVEIIMPIGTDLCSSQMVDLPAYFINCEEDSIPCCGPPIPGSAVKMIVTCLANGVPFQADTFVVSAGDTASMLLWFHCEEDESGPLEITCVVEAYKVDDPSCASTFSESAEYTCHDACVDIAVGDVGVSCVSGGQHPVTVTNCSSEVEDILVECMIDGGPWQTVQVFEDVEPGGARQTFVESWCSEWKDIEVVCRATATVDGLGCFDIKTDTGFARCVTPQTGLSLDDVDVCVGPENMVPVTVTNSSNGPGDVYLFYSLDGQAQTPVFVSQLTAGEAREVGLPVVCPTPGTFPIEVTGYAYGAGTDTSGCVPYVCQETGTVGAVQLGVTLDSQDAQICVGQPETVFLTATNTSSGPATLQMAYSIGGVPQTPVTFTGVPAGESRSVELSMNEESPGVLQVDCTVTCSVGSGCEVQVEDQILVQCTECSVTGADARTFDRVTLSGYPNPAIRGATSIQYTVSEKLSGQNVNLTVYNVSGQVVRHLRSGPQDTGEYTMTWDLRDDSGLQVSAGVYFYSLRVGPERITQRVLVIR